LEQEQLEYVMCESLKLFQHSSAQYRRLNEFCLTTWGRIEVKGLEAGGQCLFSAFLNGRNQHLDRAPSVLTNQQLREACARWICLNLEDKITDKDLESIGLGTGLSFNSFDSYIHCLSDHKFFGDLNCIEACVEILEVHAIVACCSENGEPYLKTIGNESFPPVYLGCLLDKHFTSYELSQSENAR